jgi:hypothetical protein
MSVTLSIDVRDRVSGMLGAFAAGLSKRAGLNRAIGSYARNCVRDYLIGQAQTRHKTAEALGAQPSGHLARAAENTTFKADEQTATVSINSPGMSRAVRDLVIEPTSPRKFLTIPVIAEAYNQRAYRVRGLVAIVTGDKGVLMKPQRGRSTTYKTRRYAGPNKFTATTKQGGRFGTVWYVLVRRVKQKQDRTLLPSDEAISQAALEGVRYYVDYLIFVAESQQGGLS